MNFCTDMANKHRVGPFIDAEACNARLKNNQFLLFSLLQETKSLFIDKKHCQWPLYILSSQKAQLSTFHRFHSNCC